MGNFNFYFTEGWEHIISKEALDHILFIVALGIIYTLKQWKQVLILVTAFTIGHSVTLVLSTLDIIRFPSEWTEFLIPCTIVLTAFMNFFQKDFTTRSIRINYFLALLFGFIHGMGFANTIRMMLARDQDLGWSLFAFNVGLEAGQIVLVTVLLLLTYLIVDLLKVKRRWWVILISAIVLVWSLKIALERIPESL